LLHLPGSLIIGQRRHRLARLAVVVLDEIERQQKIIAEAIAELRRL
jgi:hypothetical protein